MNQVSELVDLPDPAMQLLVHPLDLAVARRLFRYSWLIGMLTSPAVALAVAAITWFLTQSFVVPLIVGAVIVVSGTLASRFYRDEAWAFIPRKRQDRARPLPAAFELTSGLVLASLLVGAVVLVGLRLADSGVPRNVRELTFGMAAGTGVVVALDLIAKLRGSAGQRALPSTLPVLAALAACFVIANRALFGASGFAFDGLAFWGAVAMLAVGATYAMWLRIESRRGIKGS